MYCSSSARALFVVKDHDHQVFVIQHRRRTRRRRLRPIGELNRWANHSQDLLAELTRRKDMKNSGLRLAGVVLIIAGIRMKGNGDHSRRFFARKTEIDGQAEEHHR